MVAAADSAHPQKGYVTHHLPDAALNGGDVDVYLCGPPPMVDAAIDLLVRRGVPEAHIYYDKFTTSADAEESRT